MWPYHAFQYLAASVTKYLVATSIIPVPSSTQYENISWSYHFSNISPACRVCVNLNGLLERCYAARSVCVAANVAARWLPIIQATEDEELAGMVGGYEYINAGP